MLEQLNKKISKEDFMLNYKLLEDEFIDKETGLAFCKKCNDSRILILDEECIVKCKCACQLEEINKQEDLQLKQKKYEQYKKLISRSLIDKRFEEADFEKLDIERPKDFLNALKRCKMFVQNWEAVKEKGQGFYMFGDVGTGKTLLTACIGKALMKNYVPVLFTSFVELSKQIRNTYNNNNENESDLIYNVSNVPLLIIDDIGTERVKKDGFDTFLQEKIFDIINARYGNKKSTIFTSNYSMKELLEERGFEERTIDRINEMSKAVFELRGSSFRGKLANEEAVF